MYIRMKSRAAAEVGIIVEHRKLPSSTTERDLLAVIAALNTDSSVHALLLQLPLDSTNNIGMHMYTPLGRE